MKQSFPPIATSNARILILGTMPGEESLARREYYANPRNKFWRIMQSLFDIPPSVPYAERITLLQDNQISLSVKQATAIAYKHRDQLLNGCKLLGLYRLSASNEKYAKMQKNSRVCFSIHTHSLSSLKIHNTL